MAVNCQHVTNKMKSSKNLLQNRWVVSGEYFSNEKLFSLLTSKLSILSLFKFICNSHFFINLFILHIRLAINSLVQFYSAVSVPLSNIKILRKLQKKKHNNFIRIKNLLKQYTQACLITACTDNTKNN